MKTDTLDNVSFNLNIVKQTSTEKQKNAAGMSSRSK